MIKSLSPHRPASQKIPAPPDQDIDDRPLDSESSADQFVLVQKSSGATSCEFNGRVHSTWMDCRKNIESLARRAHAELHRRQERSILARMLTLAVERLPSPDAVRGWYAATGDTQTLRRAIDRAHPHTLYGLNSVLKDICRQDTVNASIAVNIRRWLDSILGVQETLPAAKTACKRLFLLQHEDRVGKRDFGSPLYQRHADEFWDLLKTTRAILAHKSIAPMLYNAPSMTLKMQKGLSVFFGVLVGLAGLHCWRQMSQSYNRLSK